MRFRFLQSLAAPRRAIEEALFDPQLHVLLPGVSHLRTRAELVRHRARDGQIERVIRFEMRGLHALCGSEIGPDAVTFTAWMLWQRAEHAGIFDIQLSGAAWPLARGICQGKVRLVPTSHQTTSRLIEGEMEAEVPIGGTRIERTLHKVLGLHFDAEAAVLETLAVRHVALFSPADRDLALQAG